MTKSMMQACGSAVPPLRSADGVLQTLLIGGTKPFGPRAAPSGIDKRSVDGPIYLHAEGFRGDEQGDRRHHGGPEKAVHHYAYDHYAQWRDELGDLSVLRRPGAFGENFSSTGLTEEDVAVGDIFQVGGALLQVSQGRQPCWKLNYRFGVNDMALRVQNTRRTGWYYRVLVNGFVTAGDSLVRVDRPTPDWTIDRIARAFYVNTLDLSALAELAELPTLASSWREHARRRIETLSVEDWSRRLVGEPSND